MTYTQERLNEIVEQLAGTCGSLPSVLTPKEENDRALADAIDEQIFECEVCGWWCWRDEESSTQDGVCDKHDEYEDN